MSRNACVDTQMCSPVTLMSHVDAGIDVSVLETPQIFNWAK